MQGIVYREMNPGEESAVCDLVAQVFKQFVAPDYSRDGVDEFFRFANPDALKKRVQADSSVLAAYQAKTLVGVLEFVLPNRIAMLFVNLPHQGIAKKLVSLAVSKAREKTPASSELVVHSSPYAQAIYQKMGFQKTGDSTTKNGITYTPMALSIPKQ